MSVWPDMSTRDDLLERVRAAARLAAALPVAASADHLGARVCKLSRELLHVDAVALWAGAKVPRLLARDGFVLDPPAELPGGQPGDLERLAAWGAATGFRRVELAPIQLDWHPAGALGLFTVADGPRLEPCDLATLGDAIGAALAQVRTACELKSAYEKRDREQDQVVRNERMRALGAMALGIAHDFNNVLNGILAQLGVLERLAGEREDLHAAVARLRKTALDGAATVEQVQDFSRQRRDQDEFSPLTFAELVEAAAQAARERGSIGLDVRVVLGSSARVHGSADELSDALQALVDNAMEAMPTGGTLTLDLAERGDELVLVVADTGRGMSRDVRRRAFDPFFTTKGSRKRGLGLSVAYGVVRRHGGSVELDSAPGKGTRVRVRLPLIAQPAVSEPTAAPAPTQTAPARSGPPRVLLVEDDPDNREAMASLLELSGYAVTSADTGSAGVRAFSDASFDVVLTDLGLPDMNGWQVAGTIKSAAPAVPVALITGWGFNLDADEIRRRGVDLLVKKPIDPRRFLSQLEGLVSAAP